jgi:hypothetical protein
MGILAPVRLVDQEPEFVETRSQLGVGVKFWCPCRKYGLGDHQYKITILFLNPLAGGKPLPEDPELQGNNDGHRWARSGLTFEDLTLSPSIDASKVGCWHGKIEHGFLL